MPHQCLLWHLLVRLVELAVRICEGGIRCELTRILAKRTPAASAHTSFSHLIASADRPVSCPRFAFR
jgi:hypothetical protein